MPKLTKGILTIDEAKTLAPDYVKFQEDGDYTVLDEIILPKFETLKKGQEVVTKRSDQYVRAKVSSLDNKSFRAIDGPVVRVTNGEFSWRVDGSNYAYPIKD